MLSEEQFKEYRAKGYVLVRGLFAAGEVAAWEAESRRLLRLGFARGDARTFSYKTATGLTVVDRVQPVVDLSPTFAALAADGRLLAPLAELYGGPMLLFKDKLIYKMPGVPGYPLHQDYSTWQRFPRDLANVVVSIDGADGENGGIEFFPGYQDRLLSAPGEIRQMDGREAAQVDLGGGEIPRAEPGDLIVFDCLTPHRSGVNRSARLRRQLYFTYSSAAHGSLYEAQLEFMAGLRGEEVGSRR